MSSTTAISEVTPTSAIQHLVVSVLGGMGSTSDNVADVIRSRGLKGVQLDGRCCPVSRLLTSLPELRTAEVHVLESHVLIWTGDAADRGLSVDLPAPVSEFVTRFDSGVYRDLVELPAPAGVA